MAASKPEFYKLIASFHQTFNKTNEILAYFEEIVIYWILIYDLFLE